MIKLAAFLGNPGQKYRETRHNLGHMVLENSNAFATLSFTGKFKGEFARYRHGGQTVIILKPLTFMNVSGESVRAAADFFKLSPEEILVVHDDLELNFGEVMFKKGGGLGGHNGLRSIATHLNSREFYRFRIGIGRPQRGDVSSFVLGKFTPDEKISLPLLLERCAESLEDIVIIPVAEALRRYPKKKIINL